MDILSYEPPMAGDLAAMYNRAVEPVPHCYPTTAEAFAAAVAKTAGQAKSNPLLRSKAAFVVDDDGTVLGFIDTAVGGPMVDGKGYTECGVIPFFWYEPGRRAVGQALLARAEARLRDVGMREAEAFPQEYRYDFYHLHAAYLSDHLPHVGALLAFNGYRRVRGEVYLDWPDFEPIDPPPAGAPADISVQWSESRGTRPNVKVLAHHDGKQIGECECESCGELTSAPEAQDWFMTTGLFIADEMQGRGLGKYLLRRALAEMRGAGYRHAIISTSLGNDRAFVFYSNFGYRFCDWTYGWRRELAQ